MGATDYLAEAGPARGAGAGGRAPARAPAPGPRERAAARRARARSSRAACCALPRPRRRLRGGPRPLAARARPRARRSRSSAARAVPLSDGARLPRLRRERGERAAQRISPTTSRRRALRAARAAVLATGGPIARRARARWAWAPAGAPGAAARRGARGRAARGARAGAPDPGGRPRARARRRRRTPSSRCATPSATSRAKERAFIDDVTEVYNARYLLEAIDREIRRAERYGAELSVLFLDLDRFKLRERPHGHLVGSQRAAPALAGARASACARSTRWRATAATSSRSCWSTPGDAGAVAGRRAHPPHRRGDARSRPARRADPAHAAASASRPSRATAATARRCSTRRQGHVPGQVAGPQPRLLGGGAGRASARAAALDSHDLCGVSPEPSCASLSSCATASTPWAGCAARTPAASSRAAAGRPRGRAGAAGCSGAATTAA